MALSRVKVWGTEVLYAADLNAEFNNILDNAASLISPLPGALDWDGYAHTLDAAGVTTAQSTAAIGWSFTPGSKSGTPSTTGGIANYAASTWTDSATAGSGTATSWVGHAFQRPTLAASNALVTTTDAATVYIANNVGAGTNQTLSNTWALWVDAGDARFDGNVYASGLRATAAVGWFIQGLLCNNSSGDVTNDIDISGGMAMSSDAAQANRRSMVLTSTLTKRLDASWAVGSGNGGLDSGVIANTDYFVWLIMRSDTGVVDALFSTSGSAPAMPTNYDFKRLIGWFRRTAGAIVIFNVDETAGGGIKYHWDTAIMDVNQTNTLTTSRQLDVLSVPIGIRVEAEITAMMDDGALGIAIIQDPSEVDLAPSNTAAPGTNLRTTVIGQVGQSELIVMTDTSGRVASRASVTVDDYEIVTRGFQWSRR